MDGDDAFYLIMKIARRLDGYRHLAKPLYGRLNERLIRERGARGALMVLRLKSYQSWARRVGLPSVSYSVRRMKLNALGEAPKPLLAIGRYLLWSRGDPSVLNLVYEVGPRAEPLVPNALDAVVPEQYTDLCAPLVWPRRKRWSDAPRPCSRFLCFCDILGRGYLISVHVGSSRADLELLWPREADIGGVPVLESSPRALPGAIASRPEILSRLLLAEETP